jgi:nucleotide-binding universal stress UspA family protein
MAASARTGQGHRRPSTEENPMRSTIVCGVDRSPHSRAAARLAIALGRRLRRRVELVHVIEGPTEPSSRGGMAALQAVLQEELDLQGIPIRLKTGSASRTLSECGRRAALVVIGGRGEGAARPAPLGGVCRTLVGDPPCPLLAVPPAAVVSDEPVLGGRTILCGVRDERDTPPAHAAAKLASALGLDLTLAHVVPSTRAAVAGPGPEDGRRTIERIARSIATNSSCDVELRVLDGPPGPQLDHLGAATGAAMVVVGAPERGLVAAALAGAPSRHLLRFGSRPVLLCPRPGSVATPRALRAQESATATRPRGSGMSTVMRPPGAPQA